VASASSALADDFDVLRGPQPVGPARYYNWSGFYFGGQFGWDYGRADFSQSTQAPIAYSLRNTFLEDDLSPSSWPVLGTATHGAQSFGGYVGYNSQWQDLVVGVEGNYTHSSLTLIAPSSSIARTTTADSQGNTYAVALSGVGTLSNLDYATIRGRAGWVLGNFMPYAFVGATLGRANVNVTANVVGEQNPPATGACLSTNTPACYPFAFSSSAGNSQAWLYGIDVGGGLDVALTRNFFVRAEFEFIQFAPVSSMLFEMANVRVGAAFKF
jgi:opacity protein-like surface antigen